MISKIYGFIVNIFGKGGHVKKKESRDNFFTPPRPQPRACKKEYKSPNEKKRVNKPQSEQSSLPKSFPLTRSPSKIGTLGSSANNDTAFRSPSVTRRTRESTTNPQGGDNAFDARRQDTVYDLRVFTPNEGCISTFDYQSAHEDPLRMTSDDYQDLEEYLAPKEPRLNAQKGMPSSNLINTSNRRFSSDPANRRFANICPPVKTLSQISLLGSNKCTPPKTKGIGRTGGYSTNIRSHPNKHHSKIPIRKHGKRADSKGAGWINFFERPRGIHTLTSTKRKSHPTPGFQEMGDNADTAFMKTDDINNWLSFRNDTLAKFERMYKMMTKKKHNFTANIIDANSHSYWMAVARITADKDAAMFKCFAGGKVVLTFAEYKFLLNKICTAYDLDYWDVLRKMATFHEEEFDHEALSADIP